MKDRAESVERDDATKVNEAAEALGQHDFTTARALLQEVVANCPSEYVYRFKEGNVEYIKFWNRDEFVQFVTELPDEERREKEVVWVISAYPRACYYLAVIDVEEGDYESALAHLEAGLELEPDQPKFFCEMGAVYGAMRDHRDCFEKALRARPCIAARTRARALRGKGVHLIELGELEAAEACLRESLEFEPSSRLANHELMYIDHLRSGAPPSPWSGSLVRSKPSPDRCAACGRELTPELRDGAKVVSINGRIRHVCVECLTERSKPWWRFWK